MIDQNIINLLSIGAICILILEVIYFWRKEENRKKKRIKQFKLNNKDLVEYVEKRNKENWS